MFNEEIEFTKSLNYLPNLISLKILWARLISFENFPNTPNLRLLNLRDRKIDDKPIKNFKWMSHLSQEALKSLLILQVDGGAIRHLQDLPDLPNLKTLDISSNEINDVKLLKPLLKKTPLLENLELRYNPLDTLEGIPVFQLLEYLNLRGTNISHLYPLHDFPRLIKINLCGPPLNLHDTPLKSIIG